MIASTRNLLFSASAPWGLMMAVILAEMAFQGLVLGVLVTLSLWLAIAVTITSFSIARPGGITRPARPLELFLQGWIIGRAVLIYSLTVGLVLSPLTGAFIYWLVRRGLDLSSLMRPQVFLGSFFVPLSVFLYTLAGGSLLGPVFGTLVNRAARVGAKGELR